MYLFVAFSWMFIGTYLEIKETKRVLAEEQNIIDFERRIGGFNDLVSDPKHLEETLIDFLFVLIFGIRFFCSSD
jgi:hypothetical protein